MKALTLWQPSASLIAREVKRIETRSWSTDYRGPLAIHAAARRPPHGGMLGDWYAEPWWYAPRHVEDCCCEDGEIDVPCARRSRPSWVMTDREARRVDLPLGAVVATCTLVEVVAIGERPNGGWRTEGGRFWNLCGQEPYGDFTPGRYAWLLQDIELLAEPVPARGRQRLWEWAS